MECKTKEELSDCIYNHIEDFVKGLYEETDALKIDVIDDTTVNVTVVKDSDESGETEDENLYTFIDFILYSHDKDGTLHTDIDADYADDVIASYFE
ncbi:MAG: hypothetical protein NC206_04565 [Bacteroides sp.]|nr:hypothetical protein [Roseburia sp.]MCM1346337.1 hypothetical protein [Bacteroides sp.]MCM1420926.1 hypothetical protein [Bacteroides sp.]